MLFFLILITLVILWGVKFEKKGTFVENVLDKKQVNMLHGILAIEIVLCHAYGDAPQNELLYLNNRMGVWMTSGFLFLSGYGLMYKKNEVETYAKGFICGKMKKLYIPFLIAFVLQFLAYEIIGMEQGNFIRAFLGRLFSDWFVCEMTAIYILWRVLFYSLPEKWAIIISFVLILVLNIAGCYYDIGTRWYGGTILFLIGIVWYRNEAVIREYLCRGYIWKLCCLILLWLVTSGCFVLLSGRDVYLDALWINLSTIMLWICAYAVLMKIRLGNSVICFVGLVSWPLYLVHRAVLFILGNTGISHAFAWMILAFICSIVCGVVVQKIEKLCLRMISSFVKN